MLLPLCLTSMVMRKMVPCQAEGCGHGARQHVLTQVGPECEACRRRAARLVDGGFRVRQEVAERASHRYVSPLFVPEKGLGAVLDVENPSREGPS
jgi:hypothetical protein